MEETPLQKTIRRLHTMGFLVLPLGAVGWADLLVAHPVQRDAMLIRAVGQGRHRAELARIVRLPELRAWLASGNRFELWAWRDRSRWVPRWGELHRRPVGLGDPPAIAPFGATVWDDAEDDDG